MIIKGFQPTTFLDYPGQIASIVFFSGCNFKCPYCYNKSLVENSPDLMELDSDKVLDFIISRKKLIDGVVISGGEPTIYKDLPLFLKKIKDLGLLVKLDTNGTNPKMLKDLIDERLVDYIAMDIKSSLKNYSKAAGVQVDLDQIKASIKIIISSGIDHEFRTTFLPKFVEKSDINLIGEMLDGTNKYFIQEFAPMDGMIDPDLVQSDTYSLEVLENFRKNLNKKIKNVKIRGQN